MCSISDSSDYISVSCNRYSHCIDFKNNWICFSTKYSVAIYCVQTFKVIKLLNGHKNNVNSVEWIESDDNLLISSSSDKTSIIWDLNDFNNYRIKYQLIGHKESIIISRCYQLNDKQLLSISSSNDKCVKIWLNDKQITEFFANNFIFDLKICNNKHIFDDIVIITVGANETIDFYQFNQNNNQINCLIEIKGHEDWIRSIDIFEDKNKSLLVSTSSQDCFIRVHRIERIEKNETEINQKMFSIQTKERKCQYLVNLETVLSGHEGWVTEVRWTHSLDNSLQLLSVSMDKTMIVWQSPNDNEVNGLWIESMRVGEIGGNTLGFLGCAVSPLLDMIVGYSFNGALHCWKKSDNQWLPHVIISGHFDEVTDISWDPKGEYLLSCSNDQTTRLHSRWITSNGLNSWHELARPQIHGYDIKCISMIDRYSFVSGSDEKVVRLFRATKCFANSLKNISNIDIYSDTNQEEIADSAVVPTLGLSNCAVYDSAKLEQEFQPTILKTPPTEETLLQNTLWPEIHKLYGHVFELFSVATNNSGTLIASAAKATKAEHTHIILWDIKEAKQLTQLSSHQLTVTRIRFSSDDKLILSASRDRTWALFQRNDSNSFSRIGFSDKRNGIHSRIIWDIAFTPDNQYFCSVSRDKSAVFWKISTDGSPNNSSTLGPVTACESPLILKESITAVDICGVPFGNNFLVAFGLENGNICLYFWNSNTFWTHLLDLNDSHYLTVNRILFSPKIERLSDGQMRVNIASCGADRSLHIFNILVKK